MAVQRPFPPRAGFLAVVPTIEPIACAECKRHPSTGHQRLPCLRCGSWSGGHVVSFEGGAAL